MFKPYKVEVVPRGKEVVMNFLFMRILMAVIYPILMIQAVWLILYPPFPELMIGGIWWVIFGTLLFLLIVPVHYRIKREGAHIEVSKMDSFFRRTHLEIPISTNPRITGNPDTIAPSPGGLSIFLTSRNARMSLVYDRKGKTEIVQFFPFASYFVSGNSTRFKQKEMKEIADILDIPFEP
jgi:hypothetical protein